MTCDHVGEPVTDWHETPEGWVRRMKCAACGEIWLQVCDHKPGVLVPR